MRGRLAAAMATPLLLLSAGAAAAPVDPDSRLIDNATVAGVRVEAIGESDGGRLVRMARRGRGYGFEYHLEYWRGNGGVAVGATFRRGECGSGDAGMIQDADDAMSRANLDEWVADYLRECPLPAKREAEFRRGLDAAWPRFIGWAEQALAATQAENEAIADYGRQPE